MSEAVETPPTSMSDRYDLGDTSYDATIDSVTGPQPAPPAHSAPAASEPAQSALQPAKPANKRPVPPKGPDGKFISPSAEPEPIAHNHQTLRLAQDFGFSDEEIGNTSPEVLDEVVYRMHRQALANRNRDSALDSMAAGTSKAQPVAPAEPVVPADPALELLGGLKLDDYDAGLAGALHKLATRLTEQSKEIEQFKAFRVEQAEAARETLAQTCDRVFAEHEAIFGKGRGKGMKADDPNFMRRKAALIFCDQMPGSEPPEVRLRKAVQLIYNVQPAAPVEPAEPQPAARSNGAAVRRDSNSGVEWSQAALARPTSRTSGEDPPGERKAIATARRILKEQGKLDDGDSTSIDDFPG